ncbi:MAG TPA: heavy metal translocating P-type ATPase [Candidatus Saccharimonadales bacterium]|nr:heavy metal translocating P-type ATPase [Candidatus Saccharimonadales bacterium]
MNLKKLFFAIIHNFQIPLLVLFGIIMYGITIYFHLIMLSYVIIVVTIILGSYQLFLETADDIIHRRFALDYIAILAIAVSIITREYLVAMVIALMLSTGRTLEDYGAKRAHQSLGQLADRIPHDVLLENADTEKKTPIEKITIGQIIVVRKGEVIPLDGKLLSDMATVDESSLTGESFPVDKIKHDALRSGTINLGNVIRIEVSREEKNSTYKKIITMVEKAAKEKAPIVRLADEYSIVFTLVTFIIAGFAFALNHSLESILAVLVVATPCPLILATPIALLGGVNAAAKKRIIVKKLASIEALSRVNTIIFDKTGTITLGKPKVINFEVTEKKIDTKELLGIASAIERNSLHPLAKAIVRFAQEQHAPQVFAEHVTEQIGHGISGIVGGKTYLLSKLPNQQHTDITIGLYMDKTLLGIFSFADEIKKEAKEIFNSLEQAGLQLAIFTGDKKDIAEQTAKQLGIDVMIKAECTPEDKQKGIEHYKKQGKVTAMVGDGINDAPALALADVGIVFSNEEQTAASEAADIVFLGGDFSLVLDALQSAGKTIKIAKQSIFWGIGMSIAAMIFASIGLIPPLVGAALQEAIDVIVILNALRASR